MPSKTYTGKVLSNGALAIPKKALRELRLIAGDEIQVILRKRKRPVTKRRSVRSYSRNALEKSAAFQFSGETQDRLEDLLFRKREGLLEPAEAGELEDLVTQIQIKTLEKAQALHLLAKQHQQG